MPETTKDKPKVPTAAEKKAAEAAAEEEKRSQEALQCSQS
jgi:hypothetical protein